MEPICLFPVSGIILRTCFRLFADSDVAFVFLADKLARFCHPIGKTLPPRWQTFAIGMAKFCQTYGNVLAKFLSDYQRATFFVFFSPFYRVLSSSPLLLIETP